MKENITKKQHYVPRMYLRNFCIDDSERCFEYNPYMRHIRNVNINEICQENYLYELRNEKGEWIVPEYKNMFEKGLSVLEGEDAELIRRIHFQINNSNDYVHLQNDESIALLGFAMLMILRNPAVRDIIPEALEMAAGIKITKESEKQYAWLFTIASIDKIGSDFEKSIIVFLKTTTAYPFITSSFPVFFKGESFQQDFYMPISSTIAISLKKPENALENINRCSIKSLSRKEVDEFNSRLLSKEDSLICVSKEQLEKCLVLMEDNSFFMNPYVKTNTDLLISLPDKYFDLLVIKLIEEFIREGSKKVKLELQRIKELGYSEDDAKRVMASSIKDVLKSAVLNRTKIGEDILIEQFKRII